MDWSPYASGSCYCLTSRGNPDLEAPRTLWCSPIHSMAYLEEVVQASLYVYDCSDAVMKAFCEYWSPSTNSLLTNAGELSLSLWDLYKLGGLPVKGQIFDEVVPSVECLSRALLDKDRIPSLVPFSSRIEYRVSGPS
ncbi:hypothetical protein LIER_33611 [Lithospermum erythrorhizon]|uniref:Aminotransferase-like plant mobile domain-containing protein n=1 Tax=Lithospermum erythrorhizon TaxID=34254 RepID=A0AAV3RYY4_LITER